MKLLFKSMQIWGFSPTLQADYLKSGASNILYRNDGFSHIGIIEIYEINTFSNTE